MVFFNYLTEDAYVQTGEYKVEEYYRNGYHVVQRLENITSDTVVGSAFPYTAPSESTYTVTFDITETGGTAGSNIELQVNGTAVYTESGVDETTVTVTQEVALEAGDVVNAVDVTNDGTVTIDSVSISAQDRSMPESFYREWATFAEGRDDELGYDPGAYGVGTPVSRRTIVVPQVKPVSLLYMNIVASTKEERVLVQYDGDLAALAAEGIVGAAGERIVFTDEEYIESYAAAGFNRYGYVMPQGLERSQVQELGVYTGTFVDTDGATVSDVNLYLQPIYMYQERPMFDYVYVQAGFRGGLDPNETGISGHLFRWQGQFRSESIAPINRSGDPVLRDGYGHYVDGSGTLQEISPTELNLEEDGQAYTNTDAYNVRNYRRR